MQPLLMIFCSHMILWVALLKMIPISQDCNSFTRWHSFNNCKKDAWISIKLCSCDSWKQTTRDSNVSLFWIKLQFNIVQFVAEGGTEGVLSNVNLFLLCLIVTVVIGIYSNLCLWISDSSKDIFMRVIAQNLPRETTLVEKVFAWISFLFFFFLCQQNFILMTWPYTLY